jgi:hypothetical protein
MDDHDRSPVRRNEMTSTTEAEKNTSAPEVLQPKPKRTSVKKAKPAKKPARAKKPSSRPNAEPANKKAEVIAMMQRAKGATLDEIIPKSLFAWEFEKAPKAASRRRCTIGP